jgi:hypothetical protein
MAEDRRDGEDGEEEEREEREGGAHARDPEMKGSGAALEQRKWEGRSEEEP